MNKITRNILTALLLIIAQTIIFNNINLFGYLNPFIYIIFIIYYPIKNDRIFFIFISFNIFNKYLPPILKPTKIIF